MMGNPFLTRRGRLIALATGLMLLPVSYLISYPIAYRALVGSDANQSQSVPANALCCFCPSLPQETHDRYAVWVRLEWGYRPPAEWLIDHRPIRRPVLLIARVVDTDEQIADDIRSRRFSRRLDVILSLLPNQRGPLLKALMYGRG